MSHLLQWFPFQWFLLLMCAIPAFAQRPIIHTVSAQPLGAWHLQTGIGAEYLVKRQAPAPDLAEELLRTFVAHLTLGVANNVDFTLDWHGSLVATFSGGRKAYDWGDLFIATKITLLGDSESVPVVGVRTVVKLPNTSYQPLKLGSDITDFYFQALVSARLGAFEPRLNIGFGIIGSPTTIGIQNDILTIGAACVASLNEDTYGFVEMTGINGYVENDSKIVFRVGLGTQWLDVEWSVYGSIRAIGDSRDYATAFDLSENWSVGLFLTKDIQW
ncbi:MAG: hypothetical protein HXY40_20070 [Chloroflexi bacterium]|nr:hypothetical protein [Chloroflexota bacterium]